MCQKIDPGCSERDGVGESVGEGQRQGHISYISFFVGGQECQPSWGHVRERYFSIIGVGSCGSQQVRECFHNRE